MNTATTPAPTLQIDVWYDLICPWCLIGKRHLDTALATWREQHPGDTVVLRWHAVRLIEGVPREGWDFAAFYERRLGSHQAVAARQAQVRAAAAQAGLSIAFERIRRFPDTAPAHQLVLMAAQRLGTVAQATLIERLFQGYFQQGKDLGNRAWLLQLAAECGLEAAEAASQLDAPLPRAEQMPGVPLFVFNQHAAVSGAQPPSALLQAMQAAVVEAPQPL